MRKTKFSQTRYQLKVAEYVKERLARPESAHNISIHLPDATEADINYWRTIWPVVRREFLGYVHFDEVVRC